MLESFNQNRRRMLVATAIAIAAARFSKALAAGAAGMATHSVRSSRSMPVC